ncbi:MAG: HemK family protein methyltransferase, partial [Saprospiraceae bacterium]
WLLEDVKKSPKPRLKILDIGTGSGCIAIALKKSLGDRASMYALDISPEALELADENASLHNVEIEYFHHDILTQDLGSHRMFDIIVSNPPYISRNLLDHRLLEGLSFEPESALFARGSNPDIFYETMSRSLQDHLLPGGLCFFEINEFRAEEIMDGFRTQGWQKLELRKDMQGLDRMLKVSLDEAAPFDRLVS